MLAASGRDPARPPGPSSAEQVGPGLRRQCVCKEGAPPEPLARGSAGSQGAVGQGLRRCRQGLSVLGPAGLTPCAAGPDVVESSCGSRGLCLKCDQGPV